MATILRGGKPNQARGVSTPGTGIVLHPAFGSGQGVRGFGQSARGFGQNVRSYSQSAFSFGKAAFGFEKAAAVESCGRGQKPAPEGKGARPAVVLQMKPAQAVASESFQPLAGLGKASPPRPTTVAGDGMEAMRGLAAAFVLYLIVALGALACVVAWRFYH